MLLILESHADLEHFSHIGYGEYFYFRRIKAKMKIDNDQENFNQSVGSSRNVSKENASSTLLSASREKKECVSGSH